MSNNETQKNTTTLELVSSREATLLERHLVKLNLFFILPIAIPLLISKLFLSMEGSSLKSMQNTLFAFLILASIPLLYALSSLIDRYLTRARYPVKIYRGILSGLYIKKTERFYDQDQSTSTKEKHYLVFGEESIYLKPQDYDKLFAPKKPELKVQGGEFTIALHDDDKLFAQKKPFEEWTEAEKELTLEFYGKKLLRISNHVTESGILLNYANTYASKINGNSTEKLGLKYYIDLICNVAIVFLWIFALTISAARYFGSPDPVEVSLKLHDSILELFQSLFPPFLSGILSDIPFSSYLSTTFTLTLMSALILMVAHTRACQRKHSYLKYASVAEQKMFTKEEKEKTHRAFTLLSSREVTLLERHLLKSRGLFILPGFLPLVMMFLPTYVDRNPDNISIVLIAFVSVPLIYLFTWFQDQYAPKIKGEVKRYKGIATGVTMTQTITTDSKGKRSGVMTYYYLAFGPKKIYIPDSIFRQFSAQFMDYDSWTPEEKKFTIELYHNDEEEQLIWMGNNVISKKIYVSGWRDSGEFEELANLEELDDSEGFGYWRDNSSITGGLITEYANRSYRRMGHLVVMMIWIFSCMFLLDSYRLLTDIDSGIFSHATQILTAFIQSELLLPIPTPVYPALLLLLGVPMSVFLFFAHLGVLIFPSRSYLKHASPSEKELLMRQKKGNKPGKAVEYYNEIEK